MADQDVQQILDRITAARDYAHSRARYHFAAMDDPAEAARTHLHADRGVINREVAKILNAALGLDPDDGDDYTELYQPAPRETD